MDFCNESFDLSGESGLLYVQQIKIENDAWSKHLLWSK